MFIKKHLQEEHFLVRMQIWIVLYVGVFVYEKLTGYNNVSIYNAKTLFVVHKEVAQSRFKFRTIEYQKNPNTRHFVLGN